MIPAPLAVKLLIEFLGTGFLVGTVKLAISENIHDQYSSHAPFAIATVLMIWVFIGGNVSGGQYNPSVALGCYLRSLGAKKNDFPFTHFLAYVTAQIIGGIAGGFLANGAAGHTAGAIYVEISTDYDVGEAFLCELVYNFMLVYVVLSVTSPILINNQFYGLCIGMTILVAAYSIGNVSGACLNPAVYIGTILSAFTDSRNDNVRTHGGWIYIIVPIIASFSAAGLNFVVVKYYNEEKEKLQDEKHKPFLQDDTIDKD